MYNVHTVSSTLLILSGTQSALMAEYCMCTPFGVFVCLPFSSSDQYTDLLFHDIHIYIWANMWLASTATCYISKSAFSKGIFFVVTIYVLMTSKLCLSDIRRYQHGSELNMFHALDDRVKSINATLNFHLSHIWQIRFNTGHIHRAH